MWKFETFREAELWVKTSRGRKFAVVFGKATSDEEW